MLNEIHLGLLRHLVLLRPRVEGRADPARWEGHTSSTGSSRLLLLRLLLLRLLLLSGDLSLLLLLLLRHDACWTCPGRRRRYQIPHRRRVRVDGIGIEFVNKVLGENFIKI